LDKIGAERRKTKEVFPEGEQSESIHRIDRIQEQEFLRGKKCFFGMVRVRSAQFFKFC
jgi:hypothetical protein